MKVEKAEKDEIIGVLHNLYKQKKFKCVNCESTLPFDVKDAWNDEKYSWLYIECPYCDYQNAVWKILKYQFPEILK